MKKLHGATRENSGEHMRNYFMDSVLLIKYVGIRDHYFFFPEENRTELLL